MNMNKNILEPKWEVTQFDGNAITTRTVTEAELASIQPQQFDHYRSNSLGIFAYRDAAGNWIEHRDVWPKMGPVNLAVLEALQLHPAVSLTPLDLARLTGIHSLADNGNAAVRVRKIREAHDDGDQRFVETRRSGGLAYRWPRSRTWIWIERIS